MIPGFQTAIRVAAKLGARRLSLHLLLMMTSGMVVLLAWGFLLAGIFTFIFGIVAVVIAYAKRGDAPPLWQSHYSAVIRMFWIWLVLTCIGVPLTLILIGYIPLAIAAVWTAAVGVVGFIKALESRPA